MDNDFEPVPVDVGPLLIILALALLLVVALACGGPLAVEWLAKMWEAAR